MSEKSYFVGLKGESSYQKAIKRLTEDERVTIEHDKGNAHDSEALVVKTLSGSTIGYIPREHFLKRAFFKEKKHLDARIKSINSGPGAPSGVVIAVVMTRGEKATSSERQISAARSKRAKSLGKAGGAIAGRLLRSLFK